MIMLFACPVLFAGQKTTSKLSRKSIVPVEPVTAGIRKKFNHKDDFYAKQVNLDGLYILGSEKVKDRSLREARYLIQSVLKTRPAILSNLVAQNVRVGVMAYTEFTTDIPEHSRLSPWMNLRARGLGGNPVTCGEENLLQFPGDRYEGENILIHEFAHIIDRGMRTLDTNFKKKLKELYETHKTAGNISGYGMTNPGEFWAEGVQSWFNCNKNGGLAITRKDGKKIELNTRDALKTYLPDAADFICSSLNSNTWSYTPISTRLDQPHLKGYDPAKAPAFVTPEHIRVEGEKHKPGRK
jgi:hypothetical protein